MWHSSVLLRHNKVNNMVKSMMSELVRRGITRTILEEHLLSLDCFLKIWTIN